VTTGSVSAAGSELVEELTGPVLTLLAPVPPTIVVTTRR
jgi:hypothetical protein